ncbi:MULTISPECIES: hypothetical protein [Aurantimonas]|uniref:phosphorylase family protein n=1 Tax=Aurantimonas TaxID=182269 RepID=UPI0035165B14
MTRALIIEDEDDKFDDVRRILEEYYDSANLEIRRASTRNEALRDIYNWPASVIVVDLNVPGVSDSLPTDETDTLLDALITSEDNARASVIVLSGYPEIFELNRDRLVSAGMATVEYVSGSRVWESAVKAILKRTDEKISFPFIIITALAKERDAFRHSDAEIGDLAVLNGLDCQYISVRGVRGVCIKLPRMGLVDSAVVTATAISTFAPACVAMGGICGGVEEEAALGTLVVADPVWEYQSGKWSNDDFKLDMYQENMRPNYTQEIKTLAADLKKNGKLKEGFFDSVVKEAGIKFAPMATGSAVIANKARLEEINGQHRKLAAIDMEMYGVYRAAALSRLNPFVFGAKTVVDTADSRKGDQYHEAGSVVSARFCVAAIDRLIDVGLFR